MAKAKQESKQKLDKYDACSLMHTALRKCCDSPITSALYNIIHMIELPPEKEMWNPWVLLGQLTADLIAQETHPVEALKAAHSQMQDAWDTIQDKNYKEKQPPHATSALYALTCTMKCFDENDWEGMASFLNDN